MIYIDFFESNLHFDFWMTFLDGLQYKKNYWEIRVLSTDVL